MLSHVYEIEGLMLVTRRLGEENTPQVITDKIQRKVRELAEMCNVTLPVAEPATPEPTVAPAEPEPEPAKPAEQDEPAEPEQQEEKGLPDQDYDADETWQHDNGEEFKEVFELNYVEPQHTATTPTPPPFKAAPASPVVPEVHEEDVEPVPEPDPDVIPEADDEPDITVEFIEAEDEAIPEPEDMPLPPVPTEFPEVEETAAPMRVDEKLQRSLSKDIRKAFSLNDRFRFQRELFAGSSRAMDTAIENIEAMRSYGNAELYFFTQLGWDRDNEVVKDFMNIVRNHFQP